MSRIYYIYKDEGAGKFGQSITVGANQDGSIVIGVYGPPLIDGGYQEPGAYAAMTLPATQTENLIEGLMAAIPR